MLPKGATIFDGGIAKGLQAAAGVRTRVELQAAAARAVISEAGAVRDAYRRHAASGVNVLLTNTCSVAPWTQGDDGNQLFSLQECKHINATNARLAREAADAYSGKRRKVRVAGCVAPLALPAAEVEEGGSLGVEEMEAYVECVVEAMLPYVDIWFMKDLGSVAESIDTAEILCSSSVKPIWASWEVERDEVAAITIAQSGEPLDRAVLELLSWVPSMGGMLVNSFDDEIQKDALVLLRKLVPFGHEAQIGSYADDDHSLVTEDMYFSSVEKWSGYGATLIGTSACLSPEHIEIIAGRKTRPQPKKKVHWHR
mmetsp:Transcript_26797/g.51958  ORF Transcript_26797/g.51958 Transcript_26797/m.51958 type:complete len:312 (+) Transcript_26797:3-938(+)